MSVGVGVAVGVVLRVAVTTIFPSIAMSQQCIILMHL